MKTGRDLVVDSVTGVHLALPVAGPGARCYAFLIDWLIRAILCITWYAVAALIYNGRWSLLAPLNPDAKWFVLVVTPAATMYFLYHFVLEIAMSGRTPGKRTAGIHIVMRDGSSPGASALLIRNVFRLVDALPLVYGVGLATTLLTKDHVRVGDMAAGTFMAYERTDVVLPELTTIGSSDAGTEVVSELLSRWTSLDNTARRQLAIAILSRYRLDTNASCAAQTDLQLRSQLEKIAPGRTI